MKTTQQMFGKVVRDLNAAEQARQDDLAEQRRRAEEAEARLDEPLTRREVLAAIEQVAADYGCNGTPESAAIADAFRALGKALS